MARDEAPLWVRGATFLQGLPPDPNNPPAPNVIGKEWRHEDVTYGTNQYVTVRAVRNTGTFALLPGRLASPDPAFPLMAVNGYPATAGSPAFLIDEFLPPAGVSPQDVCWAVVEGPCLMLTDVGGASAAIAFDDPIATLAAATSGATTGGRIVTLPGYAGGTATGAAAMNVVGRAMSAATTGNTGKGVLVYAMKWF